MNNVNALYKDLSTSAQLMLVVALVSVVFNALVKKFDLVVFLGTLLGVCIAVYNNNCLVKGNCNTWAWVLAVVYAVGVVAGNMYVNKNGDQ